MSEESVILANVSTVAIEGHAVLIEGKSGSGKSSLALSLIDRGAGLIGDDAVKLDVCEGRLVASPPPNIAGKLEIRGVGLVDMPTTSAPVGIVLALDEVAERMPLDLPSRQLLGCNIPVIGLGGAQPHDWPLRAKWALRVHGLGAGTALRSASKGDAA